MSDEPKRNQMPSPGDADRMCIAWNLLISQTETQQLRGSECLFWHLSKSHHTWFHLLHCYKDINVENQLKFFNLFIISRGIFLPFATSFLSFILFNISYFDMKKFLFLFPFIDDSTVTVCMFCKFSKIKYLCLQIIYFR